MNDDNNGQLADGEAMLDDEDDYDWEDDLSDLTLVPDEQWEDWLKVQSLKQKHPGLYLMKVTGYSARKFSEISEWCEEYCTGRWERINWSGHCSYVVIVGFEKSTDAVYYRLRWG